LCVGEGNGDDFEDDEGSYDVGSGDAIGEFNVCIKTCTCATRINLC